MKLTSIARTKKERTEGYKIKPSDAQYYSYGTCIRLEKEELKKLGIDTTKLSVGDQFTVEARCEVKSISQNDTQHHKSASLELQIEELGLEKQSKSVRDAVERGIKEAKE